MQDYNGTTEPEYSDGDNDNRIPLEMYCFKTVIQGELYFAKDRIMVSDTNFGQEVACFNILVKKATHKGIVTHRLYVKTYNKDIIEWLKDKPIGTLMRVEGNLENLYGKNYINAKYISAYTDEYINEMRENLRKAEETDWSQTVAQDAKMDRPDTLASMREAERKLFQIRNQARLVSLKAGDCFSDESDPTLLSVDSTLTAEDVRRIKSGVRPVFDDEEEDENEHRYADPEYEEDDDDDEEEEEERDVYLSDSYPPSERPVPPRIDSDYFRDYMVEKSPFDFGIGRGSEPDPARKILHTDKKKVIKKKKKRPDDKYSRIKTKY